MTRRTSPPSTARFPVSVAVLLALFREEWRLHVRLFGGYRFLVFPVVIAAFAVGGAHALAETGRTAGEVASGLHLFAIGFGLYAGTAGFAGSDMLEDAFGEFSPLLATPATLPLSRRRLLGLFLLKDAAYYGVLFVLPMALAVVPLAGLSRATPATVLGLWASLWLAFAAGMVTTVSAIAARTRGVSGAATLATAAVLAGLSWTTVGVRPIFDAAVAFDEGPAAYGALAAVVVLAGAVAVWWYDPAHEPPARTATHRFARFERATPVDDPLVTKALVDLGRSSGGFAKPFVSVGILFVLVAALVGVVGSITGIEPGPGIFFGAVLGLSAFTTYNWLTQFDDVEAYRIQPVAVADVFRAKRTAFVLVGAPTAGVPYLVAVLWFEATVLDAVAGAAVLAGYSLYYYGLTVYVAGFSPNEFLFDGVRFALFGLGVAAVLLPTLLAGFAVAPPPPWLALSLAVAAAALGALGLALTRRAAERWTRVYREATSR